MSLRSGLDVEPGDPVSEFRTMPLRRFLAPVWVPALVFFVIIPLLEFIWWPMPLIILALYAAQCIWGGGPGRLWRGLRYYFS